MAEFVHTTPLLSYTLCRVNYEPCSLLAYFFAVDKTRHTLLPCISIGNKVGVVCVNFYAATPTLLPTHLQSSLVPRPSSLVGKTTREDGLGTRLLAVHFRGHVVS